MVQGQVVFLKVAAGGHFYYLIFSRFIIFTFRNTLRFAKLCYALEEEKKFLPS